MPPSARIEDLPATRVAYHHVVRAKIPNSPPIVRGSNVPVRRLWSWHKAGTSVETLFRRYPAIAPAAILSALAFAYDNAELIEADLRREEGLLRGTRNGV